MEEINLGQILIESPATWPHSDGELPYGLVTAYPRGTNH